MSDDRAVSMPHGPVLSSTLDLIKGRLRSGGLERLDFSVGGSRGPSGP
ncbi:hypothetical protein P4133_21720 [Pseudomonas aeruginosa]|nr:hypothetical protein [Pseudomonas aeruginosa]